MNSQCSVVVMATAWGSAHGGVNSFNADMCCALAAEGCVVHCLVLNVGNSDIGAARSAGVQLIALGRATPEYSLEDAELAVDALRAARVVPTLWIGHDLLTGPVTAATRARLNSTAPYAIVHHQHYLSYKGLEKGPADADEKDARQRQALCQASIVFAVGPKLVASAEDSVRALGAAAPPVRQLVPGLAQIEPIAAPNQLQLFFAGRLDGTSARLKQVPLAVAAFGRAISMFRFEGDPMLTLVGASNGDAKVELEHLAEHHAGRFVRLHALPFTQDRSGLYERLRQQTAAMLLSVHEGFGLTAWEAIGAGVPLIISKNTGSYEFLHREYGGPATGCVAAIDIKATFRRDTPDASDVDAVAELIGRIGKDPQAARRDAIRLRSQLLSQHSWANVARTVLKETGFASVAANRSVPAALLPRGFPPGREESRRALFDVYDLSSEPFYLRRGVDTELKSLAPETHVWLWGRSGTGKTTALRHAFMRHPGYRYVTLAGAVGRNVAETLEYIRLELASVLGVEMVHDERPAATTVIRRITDLVSAHSTSELVIHIDEIAMVDSSWGREFTRSFVGLLTRQTVLTPGQSVRYVLSTIDSPSTDISKEQQRVFERLVVMPMLTWSRNELEHLLQLIEGGINRTLSSADRNLLLDRAAGSPRFVKMCLRKVLAHPDDAHWPLKRIVDETLNEVLT